MILFILVLCEAIPEFTSGVFTISTDGSVTSVNYTCAFGYTMTGEAVQTCRIDGSWSSVPPTCSNVLFCLTLSELISVITVVLWSTIVLIIRISLQNAITRPYVSSY